MAQEQSIPRAGDSNRITRAYLDALLIETRYLDAVVPDTTMELYGETFRTPVMTAALSHLDRIYPETRNGMVETAKGAYAADAVMSGGTLVYATCSMFKRENQDLVGLFLEQHPDFELVPYSCPLTGVACDGMQQLWPWDGDCDAMFMAKMRRK